MIEHDQKTNDHTQRGKRMEGIPTLQNTAHFRVYTTSFQRMAKALTC